MRDGKGWKAVELDEVEALPWAGAQVRWHPLRETLGTRIVGIAAFTAERAGDDVVEPHDESNGGRGHEEIYVVLRGRARFTLDGDELDAPAGTFVLVSDTRVHRHAIAQEAGTAVLALGGPPTFEPSASEWIEHVRTALEQDPDLGPLLTGPR